MTFLIALIPLAACAGLIALFASRDNSSDARFAARHRVPLNGRTWHTTSTATTNYGVVAVDPLAHAAGLHPVAHADTRPTFRGAPDGVGLADRATSRDATRLVGRTSTGVTTGAARVG